MTNKNLPKLFFIISMFFGILFLFIVPSFNSPDEDSHFLYSYEISEGNLIPKVKNNVSGFDVPVSIFESIKNTKSISENRNNKYTYDSMHNDQLMTQNYKSKVFSNAVLQTTPKIAYIAPAIGIKIASITKYYGSKVSVHVMLQFARFISLLIYSIIGYFAIKITPKFKKSFFVVLLLPLSVFLRSMVTYDGFLLVISALTIANILKLIEGNIKFTKKDLVLFVISGFILLNIKVVYSIVFLGLFAIPNEVFENKKKKILTIVEICIFIIVLSVLQRLPYLGFSATSDSQAPEQIDFILKNPIKYLHILASNIYGQRKLQQYWLLGTFGYLDTYMPMLFVFFMKVYLFMIFICDILYEKIILPLWLKIGYLLLVIFDICGIYTMMYISWTPKVTNTIGGTFIDGVQGRYYLPFLLLIPLIFNTNIFDKLLNNGKIKVYTDKIKNIVCENFHYMTVLNLIIVLIVIFIRYYC